MEVNTTKTCPRCKKIFECKHEDITHCQCTNIKLTKNELAMIKKTYNDCICCACLADLKGRFRKFKDKIESDYMNIIIEE